MRLLFDFLSVEFFRQSDNTADRFTVIDCGNGIRIVAAHCRKDLAHAHESQQYFRRALRFVTAAVSPAHKDHRSFFRLQHDLFTAEKPGAEISLQTAAHTEQRTGKLGKIYGRRDDNIIAVGDMTVHRRHLIADRAALMRLTITAVNTGRDIAVICVDTNYLPAEIFLKYFQKPCRISVFSGRTVENKRFHGSGSLRV